MTVVDTQPFLNALQEANVQYRIDANGKLCILRKLPYEMAKLLPTRLIPVPVLRLKQQYEAGELIKDRLGPSRYYDSLMRLRRYGLITPVQRRTAAEKRVKSREYLRAWRKKNAA